MNYPLGVSDNTYGAPWNDIEIEKEIEITLNCVVSFSFLGPQKITDEMIKERINIEIKEGFNSPDLFDIKIKNIDIL